MTRKTAERYREAGIRAFLAKDLNNSFALLLQAAKEGDAEAQYRIGEFYYWGRVVPRDEKQAFMWFRKAAKQDHPGAMNEIGLIYETGRKTQHSSEKAFEWMKKAALKGFPRSVYNLGTYYERGVGTPVDCRRAAKLYELASGQIVSADYCLARLLRDGIGCKQDSKRAAELCKMAADKGHSGAMYDTGLLYYNGNGFEKDDGKALIYFQKAMANGISSAKRYIDEILKKNAE